MSGYRTYIIAVLIGGVAVAQYLGFISHEIAAMLYGLLGGGGLATTRTAIAKVEKQVE